MRRMRRLLIVCAVGMGMVLSLSSGVEAGGKVYWTDSPSPPGKIQRANLEIPTGETASTRTDVEDLVTSVVDSPQGITLDVAAGKMYWAVPGKILRANKDGTGPVEPLVTGLFLPFGIALDVAAGKMYWTEEGPGDENGKIQRANLEIPTGETASTRTDVEDLLTELENLFDIALDVAGGKMYWTDLESINRANLDGSGDEILDVTTPLEFEDRIAGIALDVAGGKMYWTDQGVLPDPDDGAILRANLDGSEVEALVTGLSNPLGIALDVGGGKMYWTDSPLPGIGPGKIQRANLDGSDVEDLVTGVPDPTGITLNATQPTPGIPIPFSTISSNKPTVVITHGWQPEGEYDENSPPQPFQNLANAIINQLQKKGLSANIFIYTWKEAFTPGTGPDDLLAASRFVEAQGIALAKKLMQQPNVDLSNDIQFIGHSLGTFVNAFAVQELTNQGINITQFTILDAPLKFTPFSPSDFQLLLPRASLVTPGVTWVDNYIATIIDPFLFRASGVGLPIPGAAPKEPDTGGRKIDVDHSGIHENFYLGTILKPKKPSKPKKPNLTEGGFYFSILLEPSLGPNDGFNDRPKPQRWDPPNPDLGVIDFLEIVIFDLFSNVEQVIVEVDGVLIDALRLFQASDSIASVNVDIPANATLLTFDFLFTNPGDGDWLTVFFNGTHLWSFLGDSFIGTDFRQGYVPIGDLAGQSGRLTFTLHSVGDPNAEVILANFQFHGSSLSHFLCYKTSKGSPNFVPKNVSLLDQFEDKDFRVKRPRLLCNPASKNGGEILHPTNHLVGYKIKKTNGQGRHVKLKNIRVDNQFGTIFVNTKKPDRLLVPSAKSLTDPVDPLDPEINHFKCYRVRTRRKICEENPNVRCRRDADCAAAGLEGACNLGFPKGITVTVEDQFAEKRFKVKRPRRLCVPVDKNGEGLKEVAGFDHLMCYKVKRARGEPRHQRVRGVHVNNQFETPMQLDAKRPRELCLPSQKTLP